MPPGPNSRAKSRTLTSIALSAAERIAVVERRLAERQDVGAPDGVEFGGDGLFGQAAGVAGDAAQPVVDRVGQDLRLPGDRAGQFGEPALLLDRRPAGSGLAVTVCSTLESAVSATTAASSAGGCPSTSAIVALSGLKCSATSEPVRSTCAAAHRPSAAASRRSLPACRSCPACRAASRCPSSPPCCRRRGFFVRRGSVRSPRRRR